MGKRRKWLLIGTVVVAALCAIVLMAWINRPLLPGNIRKQVSFVVLYPNSKTHARIDRSSIKYDSPKKILTYTATVASAHVIITNQATPGTFTDVPQLYDKLLVSLHSYNDFTTAAGKVSLTRPPNANNQQVAVVNTQGTLMFVRSDHDLSEDQWRRFFNNLSTSK